MKSQYTDRARLDIEIALAWYERQKAGLGFAFLEAVESAIQRIENNPQAFQVSHGVFRRYVVPRFPFSIFYTVEENKVVVCAVFHNRLDPKSRPE